MAMETPSSRREKMAETQLVARGFKNEAIINAMRAIPREEFVPEQMRDAAYDDAALPIGEGQTISQPFVVARMIEIAEPETDDIALEVGAGSGYAAAVLGRLCAQVYAIERIERLAARAKSALSRTESNNVEIIHGDGVDGFLDKAPFDVIIVSAGGKEIPQKLKDQLSVGGRLVMPVKHGAAQILTLVRRTGPDTFETDTFDLVMFVPLIAGAHHEGAN